MVLGTRKTYTIGKNARESRRNRSEQVEQRVSFTNLIYNSFSQYVSFEAGWSDPGLTPVQ